MSRQTTPAVARATILDALDWRYAVKRFDPGRCVPPEALDTIFEAIRLAPTSFGMQPFQVTLISDASKKEAIRKVSFGQEQTVTASHLLIFSARPDFSENAERLFAAASANGVPEAAVQRMRRNNRIGDVIRTITGQRTSWAARQAYIALGFALLTAAELGIDACPMEGFRSGALAKVLGLPRGFKPQVMMALGFRAADDVVRPKYRLPREELIDAA